MTEKPKTNRTTLFKEHLQKIVQEKLNVKISRDKAWDLFKSIINGTVEFVLRDAEQTLPLSGIGKFMIRKSKPRAQLDEAGNPVPAPEGTFIPRFRFYPSSRIQDLVKQAATDDNASVPRTGLFVEGIAENFEEDPETVLDVEADIFDE